MVTNPIPEDQRYVAFPMEEPGRLDPYGWEWLEDRNDPAWIADEPGWEPLICELVPVAEADRLRAIEARHAQIVDLWLSIDGDNEELCNAQWTQLFALLDGVAAQDVVPAVGLRSEGGAS